MIDRMLAKQHRIGSVMKISQQLRLMYVIRGFWQQK